MNKPEKTADKKQKAEQEKPEAQEQEQPESKEQGDQQEQSESKEQGDQKEQKEDRPEEGVSSEGKAMTLIQVLDFLKQSSLINLDTPLKTLVDQLQNLHPGPSTEWGLIGDSGHLALVWKSKEG